MANSSFSSSIQSYSESFTEDQEVAIYKSIKMVRLRETFARDGKYGSRESAALVKKKHLESVAEFARHSKSYSRH